MNPDKDKSTHQTNSHSGWIALILGLVTARIALIQHELGQAIRDRLRSIFALLVALICVFFAWALTLAGATAAIAELSGWPWHFVALGFAAIHLLAALALLRMARTRKSKPFPITRSEFEKDREWIESLQNKPNSKS